MLVVSVGDSKYLVGIIAVFSCAVNLQLNSEIPLRIAVEYRLRLVAVVVYRAILVNFIVIALGAVVVSVEVVCIILMKQCITTAASCVVILVAMTTECGVFIPVAVLSPDDLSASVAGCGMALITVGAEYLAIDLFIVFILADKCSAVRAIQRVLLVIFHCKKPP